MREGMAVGKGVRVRQGPVLRSRSVRETSSAGNPARPSGLGLPRRARPRERLGSLGAAALTDAELLALIVGTGTPGRSALAVGRALARRGVGDLAEWPVRRWTRVPGVGSARGAALAAAFELGRRAAHVPAPDGPIRGPEDVLGHVSD